MSYPTRIYINAKYSFNTAEETPNSFIAELPIGIQYAKSIELNIASIVYTPTYPNLTPRDNILAIEYNGAPLSYTLPAERIYTSPTDLVNEINAVTALAIGTFSWDATYAKIDYTPVLPADTWRFEAVPNNILGRLGARDNVAIPLAPATNTGNYQFELYPRLLRTSCLYLTCSASDTSKTNRIGAGIPDILTLYPMTSGEIGSVLNFQITNALIKADVLSGNLRNLTFDIRDDEFNVIEMAYNTNVNLELTIQYEDIVSNPDRPFPIVQHGRWI